MPRKNTRTRRRAVDPDAPLRAVAYLRLSRKKPGTGHTEASLDTQAASCERAVAALGGSIVATEQDVIAGDRIDRPGLWRAIARIEEGEANAIIVHSLDRFGRDQDQQGVAYIAIKRAGGRLLSATENLEEGPIGNFLRSAYSLAGALELAKIRERTNRALDDKFKQRGRHKPGRRPPYGYRRLGSGEDAVYAIDPREAAIVERIFAERAQGQSVRSIQVGLMRDGVPTPTGTGQWGTKVITAILSREVYATGEHECWRTVTVRDADGVPAVEPRPREDRYVVTTFPAFLDPALLDRARATAARNVWRTNRRDRPAESGLLRYGFGRCAGCGRALSVTERRGVGGLPRYYCSSHQPSEARCPAPASISVDLLDGPILAWLQGIIEDPERGDAYRVEERAEVDQMALALAQAAEARVAEIEEHMAGQMATAALLTGTAKQIAADRLNALGDDLDGARAERDRLVAACRLTVTDPQPALVPQDVLAAAVMESVEAMIAADPKPTQTFTVTLRVPDGLATYSVPLSWKAWQAALSVLNVTVTVAQRNTGFPRWVAEMRLPGGVAVSTEAAYLFPSRR